MRVLKKNDLILCLTLEVETLERCAGAQNNHKKTNFQPKTKISLAVTHNMNYCGRGKNAHTTQPTANKPRWLQPLEERGQQHRAKRTLGVRYTGSRVKALRG